MPRRSHRGLRRPDAAGSDGGSDGSFADSGWQRRQSTTDGEFLVRSVTGGRSGKAYRCPACQQLIVTGTPHLVVWPAWEGPNDGGVASRRHWHTSCWERRANKGGPGALRW